MARNVSIIILALVSLAACSPRPAPAASVPAQPAIEDAASAPGVAPGCTAFVSGRPVERGPASFNIEAAAFGEACPSAAVTLVIRDMDGEPIYTFAGTVDRLLGFESVTDVATLNAALSDWVGETAEGGMTATSDLPEWKEGAEMPISGDFPFYIEGELDRAQYEALRAAAKPMYCHVQGRESLACLELESPFANKIGVQALPG